MGIFLGRGADKGAWSGPGRSVMVLGPSRSGKTTGVVLPNLQLAQGPVVATSTKDDVMRASWQWRAELGEVFLFDPSGEVEAPEGVTRIAWTPLQAASTWEGALRMASAMVDASSSGPTGGHDHHWRERAGSLLAPMLFAGGERQDMAELLNWIDRRDGSSALRRLDQTVGSEHPAAAVLEGILTSDSRELSGIWSTASGVLSAYRFPAALASTRGRAIDVNSFVAEAQTLYICSPSSVQQAVAPLVVGLLEEIKEASFRLHARQPELPSTLFALDEVANIAPMRGLPALVSEGGGQGVLTLACLQDLSQAQARWGAQGRGFLSLFPVTMVLPGIADVSTLRDVSTLIGDVCLPSISTSSSGRGLRRSSSRTVAPIWKPRAEPSVIAQGKTGAALTLDARRQASWVQLEPFFPEHHERPSRVQLQRAVSVQARGLGR